MPAKNLRFERLRQKEDMLRRKQSQRELRKLMSIRGYWTKEANRRHQDFHSSVITKSEGKFISEYFFPNNTGFKFLERFLNANRYRVYEKLKLNKTVLYTLSITLVKFTEGEREESDHHLAKPKYTLITKKDCRDSYNSLYEFFNKKISEIEDRGTGWKLKSIDQLGVKLVKYNPMKGGCFRIQLPAKLSNKKIFPIIKSNDEECLKWAICYILCEGKKGEITEDIRKKAETFKWDKIKFPVEKKDIIQFEKNNPDYLIYCYLYTEKEFGIFYKNKKFHELKDERKVINLLLYKNHFFPVMNEKFLHMLIFSSERKSYVCKNCLTNYSSEEKLEDHYVYCQKEFESRLVYPIPGEKLKFEKDYASSYVPYVCYIDSEAILEPVNKVKKIQPNIKNIKLLILVFFL